MRTEKPGRRFVDAKPLSATPTGKPTIMSPTPASSSAPPASPAPATQPTFVPAAPSPRRSGGRRVAIWLGGGVALFGALLAIAGGWIFAVFGSDGVASTGRQDLSTPTSALVSGTASIDTAGFIDDLGSARIKISARADGGRPVFVGVGPAQDVDRYLAGTATDEVTSFDASPFRSSYRVHVRRHAGGAVPAAPGRQSFWVARSSGHDSATVNWKVRDGRYRVVIMNADGSRGVATQSKFGVDVPYAPWVGLGILGAGLLLTGGGVSIARGARRRRG
jgi:hypothetical protein